jgi:hypothetical protein|tara:strand:+ start:2822 stop:3061 length:240 start_codon:yes stop_codon:yes gene_type:complete
MNELKNEGNYDTPPRPIQIIELLEQVQSQQRQISRDIDVILLPDSPVEVTGKSSDESHAITKLKEIIAYNENIINRINL